jgi:hypothetical protein
MRLSFIGSIAASLILAGLVVSSAAAQNATMAGKYRYSACICQFGYGGNDCVPVVSCSSEGGQCAQSCPAQPRSK